jgi:hypothetical protein
MVTLETQTFSTVTLDFSALERKQLRALPLENQLFYSTVKLDFTTEPVTRPATPK